MDHIPPTEGILAQICIRLPQTRPRREQQLCTHAPRGNRDHPSGSRRLRYQKAPTSHHHAVGNNRTGSTRPRLPADDAVPLPCPDNRNTGIFADASGTTSLTPTARGAALGLRTDATGRLHQHHLTGTTIFGASSHGELKTLAIILDAVNDTHQQPRDHAHHVWVVVDAAVDFQIICKLAPQPLHKATDSSLGTQTLHLWAALRRLPKHLVLDLVKQGSHRYSLGNRHIDLHTHKQLDKHMLDGEDPPLQDHMHTHLQHLPPIPHPGGPPAWVPDDRM